MKRSIVQQGPTTMMVSLPIKWVRKYELKKGEQVDIQENGRELIISTEHEQAPKRKRIQLLHEQYYYIWREIAAAYVSGYEEIEIHYNNPKALPIIEEAVNTTLTGFEIIEQRKSSCLLTQISKGEKEHFRAIIKRLFLGLLQASESFLEYLETGVRDETVLSLERTNNRQAYYLKRLLTKEG